MSREKLFTDFSAWGWDMRGYSPRTRKGYLYRVKACERWMRENGVRTILWASDKQYKDYLFSTTPNPSSRNYTRQALVAFGDFLVDQGHRATNPAKGLPCLPTQRSIPQALTKSQAKRAIEAAKTIGPMPYTLVVLLFYTGLRKEEARLLKWSSVDSRWIRFKAKGRGGGKNRVVPIHKDLSPILQRWKLMCPDPVWVFPSTRHVGRPASSTYIAVLLADVGKAAKLPHFYPHLCRHSFCTRMADKKVHIREMKEAMGHESIGTTERYMRVRPSGMAGAVAALDFMD